MKRPRRLSWFWSLIFWELLVWARHNRHVTNRVHLRASANYFGQGQNPWWVLRCGSHEWRRGSSLKIANFTLFATHSALLTASVETMMMLSNAKTDAWVSQRETQEQTPSTVKKYTCRHAHTTFLLSANVSSRRVSAVQFISKRATWTLHFHSLYPL